MLYILCRVEMRDECFMGKSLINSKMPHKCKGIVIYPFKNVPGMCLGCRVKASPSRGGEATTSSVTAESWGQAQQRHEDGGDLPRHGAQGVMAGQGLRKACTEDTLEPDPGVLDRGHITRRQLVQDGQRSSEMSPAPRGS